MKKNPTFKVLKEKAESPFRAPRPPLPELVTDVPPAGATLRWDPRLGLDLAVESNDHVGALRTAAFYWPTKPELGRAVADLAVTGRRSSLAYAKDRREGVDLVSAIAGTSTAARDRAREVLGYVDDVDAYLSLGQAARKRSSLGGAANALPWLAVAPENDSARRPVNTYATNHPTFEVSLYVRGQKVRTRYVRVGEGRTAIVFLHGLGSRLEEVERVVEALTKKDPAAYTIFAIDMLNHGYTSRVTPSSIGVKWTGFELDRADSFTMLARVQEHVNAFLDTVVGGFERVIIGGGSLGGTITFRLAIADHGASSNRRYVPWSPGSVWNSFLRVEAFDEYIRKKGVEDRFLHSLQGPERRLESPTQDRQKNRARDSRFDYLCETYDDGILWFGSNASMWWGRTIDQDLKKSLIEASRRDRREVYDEAFRRTTQALAREQTYYSVIEKERGATHTRVQGINRPLYVLAGEEDDRPAHIRQRVQDLAADAKMRGWATIVPKVGHSLHDECPRTLAHAIDAFAKADEAAFS
jgi:pimeloyl-ACP methyl ester carboxylesterase